MVGVVGATAGRCWGTCESLDPSNLLVAGSPLTTLGPLPLVRDAKDALHACMHAWEIISIIYTSHKPIICSHV